MGKPTGIPWEARARMPEPRILCRRKTGQTGSPAWSREELEGLWELAVWGHSFSSEAWFS